MRNSQRITELSIKQGKDDLAITNSLQDIYNCIGNIEERVRLLFEYLDVEVKTEPAKEEKQYLKKKTKKS